MNIHLPAILMFTRGTRFWHTAKWWWDYPIVHHWCYPKQWKTPKLSTFPFSSSSERLPNNLWWGVVWWVSQASCDLINILTHHYLSKPEPGPTAHHVSIIWSGFGSFFPQERMQMRGLHGCSMYILYHFVTLARSDLHVVRPRSVLGGLPVAHWSSSPAPNSSMFELRWSTGFSAFPRSCGGLDNKTRRICFKPAGCGRHCAGNCSARNDCGIMISPHGPNCPCFSAPFTRASNGFRSSYGLLPAVGGPWSGSHVDLAVSQTRWTVCVCPCAPRWSHSSNWFFFREWIGSSRRFFRQLLFSRWTHFSELPPSLAKMVAAAGWIWGNQSLHSFKLS